MTDKTAVYSARVPKEIIEVLGGMDKRKVLENIVKMLRSGELERDGDGFKVAKSVDTQSECVYTEPKSVYTEDYCKGCEYMENALDMSKFNEVCEFKGLDRQKALDRCAQMLWR